MTGPDGSSHTAKLAGLQRYSKSSYFKKVPSPQHILDFCHLFGFPLKGARNAVSVSPLRTNRGRALLLWTVCPADLYTGTI